MGRPPQLAVRCVGSRRVTLADRFDAILLDLDGVVWRGDKPIDAAAPAVIALREAGKRVVFVTNNASRSPRDYAAKLMRMLIPTGPADVVTSAHVVVEELHDIGVPRGERVHVCGTDSLAQIVAAGGFIATKDTTDVKAVVVAWNPDLVMEDIRRAADVARTGLPFIAANRDATYPSEDGLLPGSGAILAAVETASGQRATVVGKPAPALINLAMHRAGAPAERTLFVGDRADSDVAGARAAGIAVALVLTGVTTREQADAIDPIPDWILDDVGGLIREGAERPVSPVRIVDEPPVGLDAPPAEWDDEEHPGDEPPDVSEEGHAASLFGES
jgi:glycerol-1-phosphatase